jgi:hypothetical protein
MTGKYLITTDSWFYAPNGLRYKAVWGEVKILDDSILGIKTNRNATNWFARIGSEHNHIIVAGCQIHYALRCESMPSKEPVRDFAYNETSCREFERPSEIYITE